VGGLAFHQPASENKEEDKHVESVFAACLDAGSNPASSTNQTTSNEVVFIFPLYFYAKLRTLFPYNISQKKISVT